MNCPLRSEEHLGILLDYSAGRLDGGTRQELEKHMRMCGQCSAAGLEHTDVWTAMDAWEAPPVSFGFSARVMRENRQAESAPWYRQLWSALGSSVWRPAVPLAAAMVLIAAGFMMDHRSDTPSHPRLTDPAGVTLSEADQAERTLDDIQLLRQFDSAVNSRPL